ncbi:hypothetical protein BZG02_03690 [Labilibaculum filiforme]|uniref:DUF4270 domain-containing protein n=1 Tax=Labilibaculum filiforme TaxID=1940526 RepID=A0A2N3I3R5_9BACT|nr:DUF4270 family protein [Labilibaculum filiforme]PKQ64960.1 hypothetical protein BZG02_03690 [Labilibaculum filiforme]
MNRLFLLIIIFSVLIIGCNSEEFEIHELGGNLIESSTVVTMLDTFTVTSSTVIRDSVQTSSLGSVSVGRYVDDYLGSIKATSYSKVDLGATFSLETTDKARLDSIVLVAYSTGIFWGDTTQMQTINVHRVTDHIEINSDTLAYFNTYSLNIDPEVLGTKTFVARPKRKTEVNSGVYHDFRIRLNDELGQQILDSALVNDGILSDATRWEEYLEGIALVPGENDNASVLNFQTDSMNIRLYYRTVGNSSGGSIESHRDFKISKTLSFTNYQADRSNSNQLGTNLSGLVESEIDIPSEQTNNLAFIQGGTGIYTKLKFPYLELLNQQGDAVSLLKAELLLYPEEGTDQKELFPLNKLNFELYQTDRLNRLVSQVVNSRNSQITSIYYIDYENPEDTPLTFDLTTYVSNVLVNGMDEDDGLLVKLTDQYNNAFVNRMVVNNDPNSSLKIKLRTTYAVQK